MEEIKAGLEVHSPKPRLWQEGPPLWFAWNLGSWRVRGVSADPQGCPHTPPTHTPAPQSPPVPEHPGPELGRGGGQGASGELAEGAGVLKRS